MKWPKEINTLDKSQPHESWGGWKNFLETCEIRDSYYGITFFGETNCNYILFRDGLLIRNYGYHGKALMNKIRDEGAAKAKKDILDVYKKIRKILIKLLDLH